MLAGGRSKEMHRGGAAQEYESNGTHANNNNTMEEGAPLGHMQTYSTIVGPSDADFNPEAHKRMFRQFGNPAPLGLNAFALSSFVAGLINLRARSITEPNIVVGLALFLGGLMMILSGMWEMALGNTFGATTLTSYGGFWLSYACIFIPSFGIQSAYNPSADGGAALASAVGLYLVGWVVFTTLMLLCTLRATVEFFLLFLTVDMTFIMLSIGYFKSVDSTFITAGGAFSMAVSAIGWYMALSGLLTRENSFFQIPLIPFPWSPKTIPGRHRPNDNPA